MNRKVRVVLAGCGGISKAWLEATQKRADVEIVGMVDLVRAAAESKARTFGLTGVTLGTDLREVLTATRPDVVFDCTLPEAHADVAVTALQMGCHVFGEKPLADTMKNARRIVATARETGRMHAVMQNRRYLPNMAALREFLAAGTLGRLTTVHCDFLIGAHFGGFREQMKHVLLLDMAIHTFDQARFLTGADALNAFAHEWNPPGSWYKHGASAVAVFEMTGGTVFCYRGSWCAEGLNTPWEARWHIIGEQGSVTWDGAHEFRAEAVAGDTGFIRPLRPVEVPYDRERAMPKGHAGCLDEMFASLRNGRAPQTVCTDNIKSLAMVHAAIASAEQGRRVECLAE